MSIIPTSGEIGNSRALGKRQLAINVFLAFINLARIRIVSMVLVACAIGFVLSCGEKDFLIARFLWTLLGTALLSGGACALNCYFERESDSLMPRTCRRPIPAGVISPAAGLMFGSGIVLVGSLLLFLQVNEL